MKNKHLKSKLKVFTLMSKTNFLKRTDRVFIMFQKSARLEQSKQAIQYDKSS